MQRVNVPLIHRIISVIRRTFWFIINPIQIQRFMKRDNLKLHIGCSAHRLDSFINIDIRYTWATDVTLDLNKPSFPEKRVICVYSNAFFEHLLREKRVEHLSAIKKALKIDEGIVCYTGIPYFKNIARFYLGKERGMHNEPCFDLYSVYHYSHGDPDRMEKEGWYYEQLHKSLFDEEELGCLLEKAGFESYAIFQYAYPDDTNPLPVNIGFYAVNGCQSSKAELCQECVRFLSLFPQYVSLHSVHFLEPSDQKHYYRV